MSVHTARVARVTGATLLGTLMARSGQGWGGTGGGTTTADWRSNTLALSADSDPTKGLVFTTMTHDTPGHASAFAKSGGYVYLFGTPNGRHGDIFLARVSGPRLLDKETYQH